MKRKATDILIVGGGPAGLSAAVAAASCAKQVTVVDDNPWLGGQIWRAEMGKIKGADALSVKAKLEVGLIEIINNAQVFASGSPNSLLAETPTGTMELGYNKLIIATGARERLLPFPGWTLPNIFGAGGLQALVKGGLKIDNKRVVVAGTGPLLLAVAEYLQAKGAVVPAIVEQAPAVPLTRFAFSLWRFPGKAIQAAGLKARLYRVPYLTGTWLTVAIGDERLESVELSDGRKIDCDYLACGFDLVPNTELAALIGCRIENGFVSVDEFQRTSCENVYCAGEPTGIGGVEASMIEGTIAGWAAAGKTDEAGKLFNVRRRTNVFAEGLASAFSLRAELKTLADYSTIICRCEDVEYGRLREYDDFQMAKLQTRCGMGACQGRVCGSATETLFGWQRPSVRPPIFPVKMENL